MRQVVFQSSSLLVAIVIFCGSQVGCGKSSSPWETSYPASGTINFNGKPLAGALIGFIPEGAEVPSSVRPSATSKEDGSFTVGTYSSADGAPAGTYKVIVTHYPVVGPPENPSAGPNDLPLKYSKAETTDLRLSVTPPSTTFTPLELQ